MKTKNTRLDSRNTIEKITRTLDTKNLLTVFWLELKKNDIHRSNNEMNHH